MTDTNRDGTINWDTTADYTYDDPEGSDGLLDRTRRYRVWVNNDKDMEIDAGGETRVLVGESRVKLETDFVSRFYERWVIGMDADNDPEGANHGLPATRRTDADSAVFPAPDPDRPWESDYIVAVHGFNNDDWDKEVAFAGTAYKRLWHLGYRGRFGVCYWPATIQSKIWGLIPNPTDYNNSTYNAWRAGIGLHSALKEINTMHDGAYAERGVRLYAHSQGNVPAAQALIGSATIAPNNNVATGDGYKPELEWVFTSEQQNFNKHLFFKTSEGYFGKTDLGIQLVNVDSRDHASLSVTRMDLNPQGARTLLPVEEKGAP